VQTKHTRPLSDRLRTHQTFFRNEAPHNNTP
jgi:hypothetical protein